MSDNTRRYRILRRRYHNILAVALNNKVAATPRAFNRLVIKRAGADIATDARKGSVAAIYTLCHIAEHLAHGHEPFCPETGRLTWVF